SQVAYGCGEVRIAIEPRAMAADLEAHSPRKLTAPKSRIEVMEGECGLPMRRRCKLERAGAGDASAEHGDVEIIERQPFARDQTARAPVHGRQLPGLHGGDDVELVGVCTA